MNIIPKNALTNSFPRSFARVGHHSDSITHRPGPPPVLRLQPNASRSARFHQRAAATPIYLALLTISTIFTENNPSMPYISIECGPLTAPQKQALIEQVTLAAAKATAIPQQFFMVTVKELPDTSFGIGGRTMTASRPNTKRNSSTRHPVFATAATSTAIIRDRSSKRYHKTCPNSSFTTEMPSTKNSRPQLVPARAARRIPAQKKTDCNIVRPVRSFVREVFTSRSSYRSVLRSGS